MSDQRDRQRDVQPTQTERELPLDTRLLSDAVIELNISRKNVGIYPPGHIQITRTIDRAFGLLERMFELRQEMTLGIAKDTLLVGQDYLDRKNPVYRDFALSLNQQGIASVAFVRGMDKSELVRFHKILTTKPDEIRSGGGIEKIMAAADIPHIRIVPIDYDSFHLTEEREIYKPAREIESGEAGLWQDFVAHLASGSLAPEGGGLSLKDAAYIDPAELARLMNERKLDSGAALQSYDSIISEHVRRTAERKQLSREQSSTLAKLNTLVQGLHPDLRKQFLSVAFQRVADRTGAADADDVLGGFPDDMIIEMIGQASAEGREISPTLTGIVAKLSGISHSGERRPESRADALPEPTAQELPLSPEHMQKLFDRETYEQYVSPEYDAMLRRLTEEPPLPTEMARFPMEAYTETLEEHYLDLQIGRALLAFMEEEIDGEDYREFSSKLATLVPDMLGTGNFPLLLDALETLRRHEREKADPGVKAAAAETLGVFADPEFTGKAVAAFDQWAKTKAREAAGFLLALGPAVLPGLLDIYAVDESPGGRRILFDLLSNFGPAAVREAQTRLRDPRAYYVRNLVMLIRWTGTPASVPVLKPLLQHVDHKVRLEVMAALLRFRDLSAVSLLREALHSRDPDAASQAVFLAGQYRVTSVVDDLLGLIKKVILFEADYTVNEEIIKALGEIGDHRAIPDLEKLAKASWTLYPAGMARMKATLFESLGRYPRESIAGLLAMGERSDDDRIKRACKKLKERK